MSFNNNTSINNTSNDTSNNNTLHTQNDSLQPDTSISKCSLKHIISQDASNQPDTKARTDTPLRHMTSNQIPVIKVYSLLNSIRHNEQMVKDKYYLHKRRLYTPLSNADGTLKKKRGNNRQPVDVSVKRQRNTDAARRSRLRKAIKMETLETRVDSLKTENEGLKVRVAVLETEVCHVAEKEARNRQRVLELEAQLSLAHKQLVE